jgi:RHH-type proline utilization regulon transcriptional repressor/proline dehydrogenase/delta 1-pyrroline-5-carboxylate dehydrogenase
MLTGAMAELAIGDPLLISTDVGSVIDETVRYILTRLRVGNSYVNRNMIGAVVGVQPFGGEGLSGTGPKAGGPRYLHRFATERTVSTDTTAAGSNATLLSLQEDA